MIWTTRFAIATQARPGRTPCPQSWPSDALAPLRSVGAGRSLLSVRLPLAYHAAARLVVPLPLAPLLSVGAVAAHSLRCRRVVRLPLAYHAAARLVVPLPLAPLLSVGAERRCSDKAHSLLRRHRVCWFAGSGVLCPSCSVRERWGGRHELCPYTTPSANRGNRARWTSSAVDERRFFRNTKRTPLRTRSVHALALDRGLETRRRCDCAGPAGRVELLHAALAQRGKPATHDTGPRARSRAQGVQDDLCHQPGLFPLR